MKQLKKLIHYDLFAGIGGFSLALDNIFYDYKIKHIFAEWGQFPTAILKKHWPRGEFYGDIRELITDTKCEGLEGRKQNKGKRYIRQRNRNRSDKAQDLIILTGGFPCQPFSQAGRRKGTEDDRYLWPEMFAIIKNVKPDWVVAENVRGLVTWNEGLVLETVCSDLESEGYEVQPLIIPACTIGAPHKRDRVWIIAHTNRERERTGLREVQETDGKVSERNDDAEPSDTGINAITNTRQQLREQGSGEGLETNQIERTACAETNKREHQYTWADDWREVAFATCHDGVDDGLPRRLDGATLRGKRKDIISSSKHRQERLKACGNAIVPQVAMEIFKSIKLSL